MLILLAELNEQMCRTEELVLHAMVHREWIQLEEEDYSPG